MPGRKVGTDDDAISANQRGWIERELAESHFPDERLARRFRRIVEQLSDSTGESIPMACQDWANTKAAYRFFSNDRVNEERILNGHFQSTRERFGASEESILVLHDTTDFVYKHENVGLLGALSFGKSEEGRGPREHTVCGIRMHSSLVVTPEGLPLGLAAVRFLSRKEFQGTQGLNKRIRAAQVGIEQKESFRWLQNLQQSTTLLNEPRRCIHVADREGDIYELFCAAEQSGTHFLVRSYADRRAKDGASTLEQEMEEVMVKGLHRIEVRDQKGAAREAVLELKYRRLRVLPPEAKQRRYPSLTLTIIYAQERDTPTGCESIDWKLITDLPVHSREEAIEKINWYAMRWKIEVFHKILKSGCKVEDSRLETAERLVNLIAVFCILAWRIFWMVMINRSTEQASPKLALTTTEIELLDRLVKDKPDRTPPRKTLSHYLIKIAQLGGYLARANDRPPGNTVMWRGLSRLTDIELGYQLRTDHSQ
jgi:hypothetical protein